MPLASAQLVSFITSGQTVFNIQNVVVPTGAVGFPAVGVYSNPQLPVLIDSEVMYAVLQNPSGTLQVRSRGAEGTQAQPHDALANIYVGTGTDYGAQPAGNSGFFDANLPTVVSIGSLVYTVTIIPGDTTFNINAGSAAAITLGAPLLSMNGTIYTFLSNTALAHVITATSLILSGSGAQPKTTLTFPAIAGAGVTLVAENGFWLANGSVTIS